MLDRALAEIGRERHGIITTDQLHELGVTRRQLRRRLESGALVRINEHIVAIAGAPTTWTQAAVAALSTIPGSALSHTSAARIEAVEAVELDAGVTVTAGLDAYHQLPGVTVRRTKLLPPEHLVEIGGLMVTSIPRTLVDLGADLGEGRLRHVVETALSKGQVTWDELVSVLAAVGARGRPGVAKFRRVLTGIEGTPPTESELERMYVRLLTRGGVKLPEMQAPAPWAEREPGRVDAMYRAARSIIELDGRTWHERAKAFERDRKRDQLATMAGFRTVRFTYLQIRNDPDHVLTVTKALARPLHK